MARYTNMGIDEKFDEIITSVDRLRIAFNGMINRIEPSRNFLKIKEASEKYRIGKNQLYRAIESGALKAYRPNGRDFLIKVCDIESWMDTKIYQLPKKT